MERGRHDHDDDNILVEKHHLCHIELKENNNISTL